MDKYLEAEKELAELMGWEDIRFSDRGSFARPPKALLGEWGVKGDIRASMPRWTRSDAAAFQLMVEHGAFPFVDAPTGTGSFVLVVGYPAIAIPLAEHPDAATAIRYAIVQAVIHRLKIARKFGIPPGN